ncbi:MAG TPA: peptidylprolyl isomerase [Thermomicrobiales bacterium]|nr:peptidylprolyl isomerase [Thermomicrobiales bacterium]
MGGSIGIIAAVALAAISQSPLPALADADEVLSTVEGREIRQSDLDAAERSFGEALKQMPEIGNEDPQLERYINFRLIAEAARDAGLGDDPEVRRTIEQMTDLILYRTFLQHLVEEVASEEALRERYDAMYDGGEGLRQVHARHIRVDDRASAEKVIEALNNGADFEFLAAEHSVAPSAGDGGDLGFVGPGDLPDPLIEAAFSLEPGEHTKEPVQTDAGWEVIKVEARRSRKAPPFDDARAGLANEAIESTLVALLTKLREREGLDTKSRSGSK